jgi:hypothetical protein
VAVFFANRLVGFDRIGEDPFKELRGKKVVDLEDLSSFSVKELKTCIGDWTERTNDRASLMKVRNEPWNSALAHKCACCVRDNTVRRSCLRATACEDVSAPNTRDPSTSSEVPCPRLSSLFSGQPPSTVISARRSSRRRSLVTCDHARTAISAG